ncbi:hypothetical protein BLNAU_8682 [Blattamonas nauphoetae]|uniref:Uncharacterized protein n=1 Tax=Blattamonas nauphoetae TaxID=2049346 RepID=A0ABQ9XXW2_9EUKA|nr:hypothetical protein BLNAU_8682 [Blattamonas nauphoetae]
MFFLFALLSASSFRTPNALGDKPTAIAVSDEDLVANTATLTLTIASGDVAASNKLTLTFTPAAASNAAGDVVIEFDVASDYVAATSVVIPLTKLGETGKLQYNTQYTLSNYKNSAGATKAGSTTLTLKIVKPPTLTISFAATSKTEYTGTFSLETAPGAGDKSVLFKNGESTVTIPVTFAADAKSATKVIAIVGTAEAGKLVKDLKYTIEYAGHICDVAEFTPADNSILTGSTKQAEPEADKKKDGAVDKITLTLVNALLPATLPTDAKNTLKLTATDPAASNAEYTLDKGEKFEWKPSAGSLDVVYLFNDCKIKAKSTVKATLAITDALTFTDQAITYEEGAKSVASVVAALFAVLALVF